MKPEVRAAVLATVVKTVCKARQTCSMLDIGDSFVVMCALTLTSCTTKSLAL
jgi:hypothetical protein